MADIITIKETKKVEVKVVEVPDYTKEIERIEGARDILNEENKIMTKTALAQSDSIIEQIALWLHTFMQPFLMEYEYEDLKSYFKTTDFWSNYGQTNYFYHQISYDVDDNPKFLFYSSGPWGDKKLVIRIGGYDDDIEIVNKGLDLNQLSYLVSEWKLHKERIEEEAGRFMRNRKSAAEKKNEDIINKLKVIDKFEL